MPDPETLAQYKRIDPHLITEIIESVRAERAHRHSMEEADARDARSLAVRQVDVMEAESQATTTLRRQGQEKAFVITMTAMVISCIICVLAIFFDQPWAFAPAGILGLPSFGQIVALFLGKKEQSPPSVKPEDSEGAAENEKGH